MEKQATKFKIPPGKEMLPQGVSHGFRRPNKKGKPNGAGPALTVEESGNCEIAVASLAAEAHSLWAEMRDVRRKNSGPAVSIPEVPSRGRLPRTCEAQREFYQLWMERMFDWYEDLLVAIEHDNF